jgi:hypothetical protein
MFIYTVKTMAFKINLSGRTRINEYTPSPIIASRCGPASAFHLWSRGFDSRYELVWKSQRSTECRAGYLRVLRLQFPPTGKVDRLGFRCVYGICIILTQSHNLCIITQYSSQRIKIYNYQVFGTWADWVFAKCLQTESDGHFKEWPSEIEAM